VSNVDDFLSCTTLINAETRATSLRLYMLLQFEWRTRVRLVVINRERRCQMSFRKKHPQLRALCFLTTTTMPNPPTAPVSPPSPRIPPDRLANLIMVSKSIVAAAELLPFPYLKGALGPIIPILEAVQVPRCTLCGSSSILS
jgi:hypothetical protein